MISVTGGGLRYPLPEIAQAEQNDSVRPADRLSAQISGVTRPRETAALVRRWALVSGRAVQLQSAKTCGGQVPLSL
jgi:hypothetical protein